VRKMRANRIRHAHLKASARSPVPPRRGCRGRPLHGDSYRRISLHHSLRRFPAGRNCSAVFSAGAFPVHHRKNWQPARDVSRQLAFRQTAAAGTCCDRGSRSRGVGFPNLCCGAVNVRFWDAISQNRSASSDEPLKAVTAPSDFHGLSKSVPGTCVALPGSGRIRQKGRSPSCSPPGSWAIRRHRRN